MPEYTWLIIHVKSYDLKLRHNTSIADGRQMDDNSYQ